MERRKLLFMLAGLLSAPRLAALAQAWPAWADRAPFPPRPAGRPARPRISPPRHAVSRHG